MELHKHLLAYILLPLIVLSGAASFYRFVVSNDYIVEYEGECDPATESCFEGCEDDECAEPYPYKYMHKYASDLRAECGPDISACEAANVCFPEDDECIIEYCDPGQLEEDEACFVPEEESIEELDATTSDDAGEIDASLEEEGAKEAPASVQPTV